LDKVHPDDRIIVTHDDTLQNICVSTMNHLHAANIQFAYRWDDAEEWTELPVGENTIDISGVGYGAHVLWVKATDEFGVWHSEQEVFRFVLPLPWYLRWWAWVSYVAIALLLLTLWVKLKRKKEEKVEMETEEGVIEEETTPDDPFLQKVDALVQKNLDNSDYNVNELSRDLGMSRMNMYRKFQSLSLPTPSDYMKMYRLKKAMELLKSSTASITEIAYKVGFSSPQYFAKCFKDTYGVTPREVSKGVS
jgi:AraC-like DNA-binding protein